ncbi:MAG: pyridoxal phosphate-dependent aminotransferase [Proteobacteria bacterium]|nr:pyridoxal phosphate-dependent aminotransferase [Pseudomonadota bacterium]
MRLSKRAAAAGESETLRLFAEMAALRRGGADIISLLEGEPDAPAPESVQRATINALSAGDTRYSNSNGLPELRKLIAQKLSKENGVPAAEDGVLVTNGAKQAVYLALQTLCGPGDEVVIPRPYWVTFPEAAKLAGAKPVFAATRGHQLDVDAIAAAVTRRTRAVVINTPNNPTGAVYPADALKALARLAAKKDFHIVSDEAYEHLVYDDCRHVSPASLGAPAATRTITIQTFSKSYSMTGFRVGYLAGDPALIRAAARLHGHMTGNVCTFAQRGAISALLLPPEHHARLRAAYQKRRDIAYASATRLFDCVKPRGGLFVFADARKHLGKRFKTSGALAAHLLKEGRVAAVPGSACGMDGWLRLSFSGSEKDILKGFARIEDALCR